MRFVLSRDPDGSRFLFAPLQGVTARDEVAAMEIMDHTGNISRLNRMLALDHASAPRWIV